jgi:hypothetical protein
MSDGQPHLVPPPDRRCRFVKTSGARCTTPALRDKDLCFDHAYRVRATRGRLKHLQREEPFKVPLVNFSWAEDHHSILKSLNEVALQLANGAIDYRQAGAFTSLLRTCLKTLRQMHDIERAELPVENFVEEEGQAMAVSGDQLPAAAPPAASSAEPSLEPAAALSPAALDPTEPLPESSDAPRAHEFAPPRVAGLSFNPDTEEGRANLAQEYIWGFCHKNPADGLEFGINLNWPGRPVGFVPPAGAEQNSPAPERLERDDATPSLNAAADPLEVEDPRATEALTPSESMQSPASANVTLLESTHAQKPTHNSFVSHTYANSRKKSPTSVSNAATRKRGTR